MRACRIAGGLLTLSLSLPAAAQEQQGSIEGRVLDLEARPLAGVPVVAKSELGATVRTQSDESGSYRFPSLLPGRWEVEASLEGAGSAKVDGIELRLGQRLTVDLDLQVASVSETVEVSGESPLLDLRQSAQSWSLRSELIDKLPRGRGFTSVVTFAPGVNREPRNRGISIDGASSTENRHVIDGAETTDPLDGGGFLAYALPGNPSSQQVPLTDFTEEIQVKSSGYAAEYGGSTGGVINVLTRSGSNAWRGDAVLYYNADGLDGDERPRLELDLIDVSQAGYVTPPKDSYDRWEPGFSLGGPLVRDKLWLFAGYHYTAGTTEREVYFLGDDVTRIMDADSRFDDAALNLTSQLGEELRLRVAYNLQDHEFDGLLPRHESGDLSTARVYERDGFSSQDSLSAAFDYLPATRFLLSARAGWYRSSLNDSGALEEGPFLVFITSNIGLPGVPEVLQRPAFFTVGDNFAYSRDERERLATQVDATYFFSGAGDHQLKGGVQWNEVTHDALIGETSNSFQLFWDQGFFGVQGQYGYYQVFSNPLDPDAGGIFQADVDSDNLGLFVQDSWTLGDRLTLNLGVRSENEKIPSYSPDPRIPATAIEFDFEDKIAPRVGFAWDVRGDGKWKAHGDWGLYYDITKLSLPSTYFGGGQGNLYWFTLDTFDWPSLDRPGCPPDCPGELIFGPLDFSSLFNDPEASLIDPGIEPMRLQEWSLGVEHQLTPRVAAGLRYLHKQVDVALEDLGAVDALGNDIFIIGNPGRGSASLAHVFADGSTVPYPEAERDYDALELTVEKRYANRWFGAFSYTYSRLEGNYSGLSDSEFLSSGAPNLNLHFDHPYIQFDETGRPSYGKLATDRPHQLKLQAVYDFPIGTSVGLHWFGLSGIPRTRQVDFFTNIGTAPVQYLGRESDGRMGFVHRTDLYLQHELRFGERRLALSVNVLNLFDQDDPTDYYSRELFFGQGVFIAGDDFYRGFDTQRLIEEQGLFRDPRFLRDIQYRPPREIRLGLRFSL